MSADKYPFIFSREMVTIVYVLSPIEEVVDTACEVRVQTLLLCPTRWQAHSDKNKQHQRPIEYNTDNYFYLLGNLHDIHCIFKIFELL